MKYLLMDYVNEAGWPELTTAEQEHWLGAYKAYMQAMTNAGVLKSSSGLKPTSKMARPRPWTVRMPTRRSSSVASTLSKWPISTPRSPGQRARQPHFTVLSRCVHSGMAPY